MKWSQPRRDWSEALEKKAYEGICRVCEIPEGALVGDFPVHLEAAHTISHELQDRLRVGPNGGEALVVDYHSTIPLCGSCHRDFHEHLIDILPLLTREEEQDAVGAVGLESANRRLTGSTG